MNTPVNFETAKKLKEKGYNLYSEWSYWEDELTNRTPGYPLEDGTTSQENYWDFDRYYAPTIAEVVMWLYKNHGIWISVGVVPFEKYYMFEYAISKLDGHIHQDGVFVTPTGAYKAAIKYTLNNLI